MEQMPKVEFGLSNQSITCFAGEDRWYHHHPHSKNHILKRLVKAEQRSLRELTMGLPSAASPTFFLRLRGKSKSYLRWLRNPLEGLYVMTPITFPLYGSVEPSIAVC